MQQQMQQMQLAMAMQQRQQQQQYMPAAVPSGGQVMKPNVMGGNSMRQIPIVGKEIANSFSFLENPDRVKKEEQLKSFDFIKDTMKNAK